MKQGQLAQLYNVEMFLSCRTLFFLDSVIHQEGLRIQKLTCCTSSAETMLIWHNKLVEVSD